MSMDVDREGGGEGAGEETSDNLHDEKGQPRLASGLKTSQTVFSPFYVRRHTTNSKTLSPSGTDNDRNGTP